MSDTKKTALAELAETLKNGYVSLVVNDRQVATFTTTAFPELDKAQRIIAELAKVKDVTMLHNLEPVLVPNSRQCYDAVVKCREIAEGGAK